jgi:putative peptidoglycan lipid II flippase
VSRHAALGDIASIRSTVSRGLAMMLMLNIPATFGLLALSTPIVQLLFERGRFLPADTAATADAVRLYAVGLVGYSAARIASPTFYALRQSRVPVAVSVATIVVNVALSVTLVRVMGFRGLALGTSLSSIANGALLLLLLRRRLGGIEGRRLAVALVKVTAAAGLMVAAASGVAHLMANVTSGHHFAAQLLRVGVSIGVAVAVLAGAAKALGIEEFDEALSVIRSRIHSRSAASL